MPQIAVPTQAEIAARIRTLEEACLFFDDLAVALPEHSRWLWDIAEKLEKEASTLVATLRRAPAVQAPAESLPYSTQRRFRRWKVAVEGRVYGKEGGARGFISEIGEGGLKTATGLSCRVGDEVVISWRFEDDEHPFQLTGVVRYQVPDGIGIEFLDATPLDRVRMQHFCESPKKTARAAKTGNRK